MKTLAVLAVLVLSLPSFAIREDWYWGFHLGPGFSFYSGDFGNDIRDTRTKNGAGLTSDVGFYWPTGEGNTIIGAAVTAATDYVRSGTDVQNGLVGFSAIHTFGEEPGDGFFVRGDTGLGIISSRSWSWGSHSYGSSVGWGFGAGVGYGFKASEQTRLLFQLRSQLVLASNTAGAVFFSFGPMF